MNSNLNDLLDRYLQAVGQYLPSSTRQDTLAELRANLLEQMDARAEELGRPLTQADIAGILRAHGQPEVVAVRYLPQRSLIGPGLFPTYLLTLRKALPFVLLIYAVAQSVALVAGHDGPISASEIVDPVLQIVPTLLIFWAVVTIVFAALDFTHWQNGEGRRWLSAAPWDPAKLPPVKEESETAKRRPLASRIADLIVHCLLMVYVFAVPEHPFLLIGPGSYYLEAHGILFAPVWHTFFMLLVALLLIQLVMKFIALVNPYRASFELLQFICNLLGVVASGIMAAASEYFIASSSGANLISLANVNHGMSIAFRITFVFALVGLIVESWKSIKRFIPTERMAF